MTILDGEVVHGTITVAGVPMTLATEVRGVDPHDDEDDWDCGWHHTIIKCGADLSQGYHTFDSKIPPGRLDDHTMWVADDCAILVSILGGTMDEVSAARDMALDGLKVPA
jgi:hypothetical protein